MMTFLIYLGQNSERKKMRRRCNICLQSKDHLKGDRFNNEVTICYDCQKILTKIVNNGIVYKP